jgi:hypothetical protein
MDAPLILLGEQCILPAILSALNRRLAMRKSLPDLIVSYIALALPKK